jgi:ferritin-like metal-binding protein YciE
MTVLFPTKETGGQDESSTMLYGEPGRQVTDEQLAGQLAVEGINAAFLADLLSGFLTHERCGRHLYRSVAVRSNNPVLKQRYQHFGEETERHVAILEQLIADSGGNPSYVSLLARSVEASDSKLLESTFLAEGALDPMTAEMAMLNAVFLAEAMDQANWQVLQQVSQQLPAGALRDAFESAVSEVLAQENDHFEWARDMRAKLTLLQIRSSAMAKVGEKAEEMMARVRDWLS